MFTKKFYKHLSQSISTSHHTSPQNIQTRLNQQETLTACWRERAHHKHNTDEQSVQQHLPDFSAVLGTERNSKEKRPW